jgi:DNA-binding CsgD family transcriptional regulator
MRRWADYARNAPPKERHLHSKRSSRFWDPINSNAADSYEQVANALQVSVGSVKTQIHRLRKQYASLLREEVARTVGDPGEIDEEIHFLCEAMIAAEGQLGS